MVQFILPEWGYEVISYSLLIVTAALTIWYPNYRRRIRETEAHPVARS
jgi:hypothetical protein